MSEVWAGCPTSRHNTLRQKEKFFSVVITLSKGRHKLTFKVEKPFLIYQCLFTSLREDWRCKSSCELHIVKQDELNFRSSGSTHNLCTMKKLLLSTYLNVLRAEARGSPWPLDDLGSTVDQLIHREPHVDLRLNTSPGHPHNSPWTLK